MNLNIFPIKRLPFDWNTPIGYLVATILQYILSAISFTVVGCIVSCGIGGFLFALAMTSDITEILNSINDDAKSTETEQMAVQQLRDYIQMYSMLKELGRSDHIRYELIIENFHLILCRLCWTWCRLVHEFAHIYQPMYLAVITWSLINICGTMLMFQIELVEYFEHTFFERNSFQLCFFFSVSFACRLSGIICDVLLCVQCFKHALYCV